MTRHLEFIRLAMAETGENLMATAAGTALVALVGWAACWVLA